MYKKLDFSICSEIILVKLLFYALHANESEYSSLSKVSSHFQLWAKPAWSNSQKNWYWSLNSGLEFYQKYPQISQSCLFIVNSHSTPIWNCVYYIFMTLCCNKTQFINHMIKLVLRSLCWYISLYIMYGLYTEIYISATLRI